jgi:hypothetical protein
MLYHDLPALLPASTTGPDIGPALLDVARGMLDMVADVRLDRNDCTDAREVASHPHTVQERLGDALTHCLLLMCHTPCNDDLPPLYHELAAHPRGVSERYTLQQGVDAAAALLDIPSFQVIPMQVMAFKNFRYDGSN